MAIDSQIRSRNSSRPCVLPPLTWSLSRTLHSSPNPCGGTISGLGLAWLVAESIHRMLPAGIVLMWPYPMASADSPQIEALDSAITRLSDHFQLCGLTPVESAPWALGMSTAFCRPQRRAVPLSSVRGTFRFDSARRPPCSLLAAGRGGLRLALSLAQAPG